MLEKILSSDLFNREEYLAAREHLRETRLYHTDEALLTDKEYVMACASIEKLMPSLPVEKIPGVFNKLYYYKGLTWIQQRYIIENVKNTVASGSLEFMDNISTARIYCTFHMGSYRMALYKLLEQGIDLAFVIAQDTLREQQESIVNAYEEIKRVYGLNNTLTFIEAENPAGVIQMVRALKEGKSLFFYIDGNTGVGGYKRNDDKVIPVDFLNASIFARRGVAYIAHKCNVPIIVCLCNYITDDEMSVTFYPPILPDTNEDVNVSSAIITQSIYNTFSELLVQYPDQWEGWMFIANILDTNKILKQNKRTVDVDLSKCYTYNKSRFSFFTYKGMLCLLDKNTFEIYPVQQELIDILKSHEKFTLNKDIFPEDIFGFLIKNEILIIN